MPEVLLDVFSSLGVVAISFLAIQRWERKGACEYRWIVPDFTQQGSNDMPLEREALALPGKSPKENFKLRCITGVHGTP